MRTAWWLTSFLGVGTCMFCALAGEPFFMGVSGLLSLVAVSEAEKAK